MNMIFTQVIVSWCPVVIQFGIQILILAFHFNSLCVQVYSFDKIILMKCIIASIFASLRNYWNKNTYKVLLVTEPAEARVWIKLKMLSDIQNVVQNHLKWRLWLTSQLFVWSWLTCTIKRFWVSSRIALICCFFVASLFWKLFAFLARTTLYLQQHLVVLVNLTRVKV